MWRTVRYQYLSILWAIFVVIMCEMPSSALDVGGVTFFEGFDKLAHTGFFFVLTVFLFYGRIQESGSYSYRVSTVVKILVLTFALGAFIELLQWKVFTDRSPEMWDLFADMLGVAMGVFSYIFLHRVKLDERAR